MRTLKALSLATMLLFPAAPFAQTHAEDSMPVKPPVPPSRSLTMTVEGHQTTFTIEQLLDMPQTTVHVHNAHRNADEEYAGPLLSDVLAKCGLTASRETEPLLLHSALVATGTDKYFVVYSAAEVEPMFAKGQVIVAVTKNNGLPNEQGGLLQLINTADAKPARWVHGLTSVQLITLQQHP